MQEGTEFSGGAAGTRVDSEGGLLYFGAREACLPEPQLACHSLGHGWPAPHHANPFLTVPPHPPPGIVNSPGRFFSLRHLRAPRFPPGGNLPSPELGSARSANLDPALCPFPRCPRARRSAGVPTARSTWPDRAPARAVPSPRGERARFISLF